MRSVLLLCGLAAAPLLASAGEDESYCALAAAQARTQAASLGAPEAFASLGDPATAQQSVVAGVRKSLSRARQGQLATRLGEAQCAAYRSRMHLDLRLAGVERAAEQHGLAALTSTLEAALAAAEAHLQRERQLLAHQLATLGDVRGALDARDRFADRLTRAQQRMALLAAQPTVEDTPLLPAVERAVADQARVLELGAQLQAETAWDLSLVLGLRRGLSSGSSPSAFAGVVLSRSLGADGSRQAAAQVGELGSRWLEQQLEGPVMKLQRLRGAVDGARAAGELVRANLQRRLAELREASTAVAGSETARADRLGRGLQVEILGTEAELADVAARQAYLSSWLARNGGVP